MGMNDEFDVIVVGGGLAGLCAAAHARHDGARVVVLEAHGLGGRARCVTRDDFVLNMGAHALYRGGPGAAALAGLGIVPDGAPPPLATYRALVGGHLERLPTGPVSLLRSGTLSPRSKVQAARFLATLPRLEPARYQQVTVADWLEGLRLRPDVGALVRALLRLGTYTSDLDAMSADAAIGQMQLAAKGGVHYLHGGWDQLTGALAAGLDVRTSTGATAVVPTASGFRVGTPAGTLSAAAVVLAPGGPDAVRSLLPDDPGWPDPGPPVTAACLDLGVARVPSPGYVLSLDDPLYVNVQSPPARQAPPGGAVVCALRYGSRSAAEDRPELESLVARAGVRREDVVVERFLASMTVAATSPRADLGGLAGRPATDSTRVPGLFVAGDWVGPRGLLADAALASGADAGRRATRAAFSAGSRR